MPTITLTQQDFATLRQSLVPLQFNPQRDAPPADPLLLRHLHDYQFPSTQNPNIEFRAGAIECESDGESFRIATFYWLPKEAKGTTFLVHGYFDHTGLYNHLIECLLEQGQVVVAFDLPGHGLSSGERLAINSFAQYQNVLMQLVEKSADFPQPFNALGQSTGGAVLLRLLQSRSMNKQSSPFNKVILMAPLIKPWLWGLNIWLFRILSPLVKSNRRGFRRNSSDREFADFLKHREPLQARRIPLVWVAAMKQWIEDCDNWPASDAAIKVIQGDRDTTVDWKYNLQQIQEKFPNSDITVVPNAMHHMVNESAAMREKIFSHISFDD